MFCSNCGKEISNDNKFCVFCGSKIEDKKNNIQVNNDKSNILNSKMIKVTVIRKSVVGKRFECFGFIVYADPPMKIIIDGNRIAELKVNEFVDINLSVGQHKFILDRTGIVNEQIVDIAPGFNRVIITVAWTTDFPTSKGKIISIQTE